MALHIFMITGRQENILGELVRHYISTAKPISSDFLEENGDFDFCPATIRSELKKLTDLGFLGQPHVSSGRVPTNKAYRFFVDEIAQENFDGENFFEKIANEIEDIKKREAEQLKFIENLTKKIAEETSGLAFVYLKSSDLLWKDGWQEVLKNPEFENRQFIDEFIKAAEKIEDKIKSFVSDFENQEYPEVFIGREKSVLPSPDISMVVSSCNLFGDENAVFAILGPSRMAYDKNIGLARQVKITFEE